MGKRARGFLVLAILAAGALAAMPFRRATFDTADDAAADSFRASVDFADSGRQVPLKADQRAAPSPATGLYESAAIRPAELSPGGSESAPRKPSPGAVAQPSVPEYSASPAIDKPAPPPDFARTYQPPQSLSASSRFTPAPLAPSPALLMADPEEPHAQQMHAGPGVNPAAIAAPAAPLVPVPNAPEADAASSKANPFGPPAITRPASTPNHLQHSVPVNVPNNASQSEFSLHRPVKVIQHRVKDGDTLASLAVRYLGSAERAFEIYEDNRQLLANPDLLPIGAVIRITIGPAREVPTASPRDNLKPVPYYQGRKESPSKRR